MEQQIEDWLINGIKHPLSSLAVVAGVIITSVILQKVFSRVGWAYKREKFFKQLEMKLYK